MTSRAWLLVGILLALLSFSAFAEETIPATQSELVVSDQQIHYTSSACGASPAVKAASGPSLWSKLNSFCSWDSQHQYVYESDNFSSCNSQVNCYITARNTYNNTTMQAISSKILSCLPGSTWNGSDCVSLVYGCPVQGGWTLVGQSCVRDSCQEGDTRDEVTGVCTPPAPPTCADRAGQDATADGYFTGSIPSAACHDGCTSELKITCSGTTCSTSTIQVIRRIVGGVEQYYSKGKYVYPTNSESCTGSGPESIALPPNSCGAGQKSVYINGQLICVNATTNEPEPTKPPSTTTKPPEVTNPDGSKTQTETTTRPDGTKVITTTTTAADGTVTTSTTTTGGDSETPLDGSATEKTQQQILDELKKTECEKNPDSAQCADPLVNVVGIDVPSVEQPVSIAPVTVGPVGSCPADKTYTLRNGQQIVFSWSAPCQFATGIRPVVLSIAWLSAALILIGAFRQES